MIRYNFHRDESGAYMVEDADGEYVRYAEVHPLVDGDLATQRAICDGLPGPKQPPRILDEAEVMKLARRAGMMKFMYDSSACRFALARFAQIANGHDATPLPTSQEPK